MKIVYIAHAISGDIEGNLADLRRIVRKINIEHADVVPLVPYYSDVVSLDDTIPAERERGIKNDIEIINSGLIEEMWLTGNRLSNGMYHEMELAKSLNIPVIDLVGKL